MEKGSVTTQFEHIVSLSNILCIADNDRLEWTEHYDPQLFSLLEICTAELIRDQIQEFSNFRSKLNFIKDYYHLPQFIFSHLCNILGQYYHKKSSITCKKSEVLSIYHLTQITKQKQKIVQHPELHVHYLRYLDQQSQIEIDQENDKSLSGKILNIEMLETQHQTLLLKIHFLQDTAQEEVIIYLWDDSYLFKGQQIHPGQKKHLLHELSIPEMKVIFYHLKYSEEKQAYLQNKDTVFVLMPDHLLDASAIAECIQIFSPELYFVKMLSASDFSLPILKGQVINRILDNTINHVEEEIEESFQETIKPYLLKLLFLDDYHPQAILQEIRLNHLYNIQQLRSFTDQHSVNTEPSFISPAYGLQGRLDALLENEDQYFLKTVFELKSGKAPKTGVWDNHSAQVICYDLLLKSVFGDKREGNSLIFYSGANNNPLREVPIYKTKSNNVLMMRNMIISMLYKCAHQELMLKDALSQMKQNLPPYLHNEMSEILMTFAQMSPLEEDYFNEYCAFILKTLIITKTGDPDEENDYGYSALWKLTLEEKLKQNSCFSHLKFLSQEKQHLVFEINDKEMSLNFREGDPLVLYGGHHQQIKAEKTFLLKGSFQKIEQKKLFISLRNEFINESYLKNYDFFVLEKDILESGITQLIGSLFSLFKAEQDLRDKFFGIKAPETDLQEISQSPAEDELHQRIIKKAMASKDYFIIQGPPGTGKTSRMIMGLIQELMLKDDLPICVLAFTNKAVDEIISRLKQNEYDYCRLGSRFISDSHHLNHLIQPEHIDESIYNINRKRLFVSTVSSFQNDGLSLMKILKSGTLIVDEASQLLEPHLCGIICLFRKWILIGDQNQLPAISNRNYRVKSEQLKSVIGLNSLNDSLFERMIRLCQNRGWSNHWDILTEHFRMHQDIANLINPYYQLRLKIATEAQSEDKIFQTESAESREYSEILNHRCLYIDIPADPTQRYNKTETAQILKILRFFDNQKILGKYSIGIVCFWKAQVNYIQQMIKEAMIDADIMVDTVERYQGSEKDVIIMSTALNKSSDFERVSLLSQDELVDRKLNVAISRAKKQLILLGDQRLLIQSPHYQRILRQMFELKI